MPKKCVVNVCAQVIILTIYGFQKDNNYDNKLVKKNEYYSPPPHITSQKVAHALEIENKVLREQLKQALQVKDVMFLHIVKN